MSAAALSRASSRSIRLVVTAALLAVSFASPPAALAGDDRDPWQPLNRRIFKLNDALDRWILEPTAEGYDKVTPDIVQGWITNFTANLWFPVVFTNCVLQGKPQQATQSLARFMVNTTVGLGGFGDPASKIDVPAPNEDFGQTLGYWGVGSGPFVMLPLLGPSSVRDTGGRFVDSATRVWPYFVPWYVNTAETAVEIVNTRARFLENVKDLRESSVDYYASVRDAYLQRRQALVEDRVGSGGADKGTDPAADDNLYFPDAVENDTP
jgi:phospholipid-binding lipoprotein MlaA